MSTTLSASLSKVDPGTARVIRDILAGQPLRHSRMAVWPTGDDQRIRRLEERIPRAANANETFMQFVRPQDVAARYRIQEKLNGVYVLWDGDQLWTKTGHNVDAPAQFVRFLPPSFPLVGELFFGYGHTEFHMAVSVSQNKLPLPPDLTPAQAASRRNRVWQHARIVAFDTPSLSELEYGRRHTLLWQVVASWSRFIAHRESVHMVMLPLQVIVQFPMSSLDSVFQVRGIFGNTVPVPRWFTEHRGPSGNTYPLGCHARGRTPRPTGWRGGAFVIMRRCRRCSDIIETGRRIVDFES